MQLRIYDMYNRWPRHAICLRIEWGLFKRTINFYQVLDSGKTETIGEYPCNHCAGTGRDMKKPLMAFPCQYCGGKGKKVETRWEMCRSCGGSGQV